MEWGEDAIRRRKGSILNPEDEKEWYVGGAREGEEEEGDDGVFQVCEARSTRSCLPDSGRRTVEILCAVGVEWLKDASYAPRYGSDSVPGSGELNWSAEVQDSERRQNLAAQKVVAPELLEERRGEEGDVEEGEDEEDCESESSGKEFADGRSVSA